jgi:hypothetical protein
MNRPHFFVNFRKVLNKFFVKNYVTLNVMEFEGLRFFDIIGPLMQLGIFEVGEQG